MPAAARLIACVRPALTLAASRRPRPHGALGRAPRRSCAAGLASNDASTALATFANELPTMSRSLSTARHELRSHRTAPHRRVVAPTAGEPMIEADRPVEVLRRLRRLPRRDVHDQQGRSGRLPRPQRRRQEHHDEAAHRLPGPVGRHGPDRRLQHGDRPARRRRAAGLPAGKRPAVSRHDAAQPAQFFGEARGMSRHADRRADGRGHRPLQAGQP